MKKAPKGRKSKKNYAGGSATGGGINFQAAVGAVAMINMASGQALGWLDGLTQDIPILVSSETGGPGDDLAITFRNGKTAEVQVKRGLRATATLWEALINLAEGINAGTIDFGILAVCPDSSSTIRADLARDLRRIASGRDDHLKKTTRNFISKLRPTKLRLADVAPKLVIITMHCLANDAANIQAALTQLKYLCSDPVRASDAWDRLYRDALGLIEIRGSRTTQSIAQVLMSSGIAIQDGSAAPVALLSKLNRWVAAVNSSFAIFGVDQSIPIDGSWIEVGISVELADQPQIEGLANALEHYHAWHVKMRPGDDSDHIAPETLGWFVRRCVVIAGPGMGKSILIKKLARTYAQQGYPVLVVRLKTLAARIANAGSSIEEGIFKLGLDGAGITADSLVGAGIKQWVLLCDGLDECGPLQNSICQGLLSFMAGHPECRVIVTTRPIGYDSTALRDWRHYTLLPLNPDHALQHASTLLQGIAPAESSKYKAIRTAFETQLKANKAATVAARSPMLLGLMLSLSVRGLEWGKTRAELYERLFHLIHATPTERPLQSPGISTAILNRFLDILGWVLQINPVDEVHAVIKRCSQIVAAEIQEPPLKAQGVCEASLNHWEQVGIVERLRLGDLETVTFIHRTFGEYAAARFLVSRPADAIRDTLRSYLQVDSWAETITFAASLGIADTIVHELLNEPEPQATRAGAISRCLHIFANSSPAPTLAFRTEIFDIAFSLVASPQRAAAYQVGESLLDVCKQYPLDIAKRASQLLSHQQSWTRLAAWALVCASDPAHCNLDQLLEALKTFPDWVETRTYLFRGKISTMTHSNRELVEAFVVGAAQTVIERCSEDQVREALHPLFARDIGLNMGMIISLSKLVTEAGFSDVMADFDRRFRELAPMLPGPAYQKAKETAFRQIFDALLIVTTRSGTAPSVGAISDKYLLHLSALFDASGFWEIPVSDIWAWEGPYEPADVEEVLKGLVQTVGLDAGQVALDAAAALKHLDEKPDSITWLSEHTRHVDVVADWSRAAKAGLATDKLVRALHHPSQWIIQLALHLLINGAAVNQLAPAMQKVLAEGKGATLWAAARILRRFTPDTALDLILARLQLSLVPGCEHLYEALQNFEAKPLPQLIAAIRNGLFSRHAEIAVQAAKLSGLVVKITSSELEAMLSEAYDHWKKHEKPYPTEGGTIHPSPRADLLDALFKIQVPNFSDLLEYSNDAHPDIRDKAEPILLDQLNSDSSLRDLLLSTISTLQHGPDLLLAAFQKHISFSAAQIESALKLLNHNDPKIRLAASFALAPSYLPSAAIQQYAEALCRDTEPQISERGYALLQT